MSNGFCTTISKLIMNHAVSRHIQPCPIISSPIQSQLHHYVRTGFYFSACLIAIFCKTFKTVSNLLPKTLLKRVRCEVSPLVERCLLEAAEVNMVKLFVFLKHRCALYFASLCAHSMHQLNCLLGLVSLRTYRRCAYLHPGFQRPKRKLSM